MMVAERVLSVNWEWSMDSHVSYRLSSFRGHENPIIAYPPYFERSRAWQVARPVRPDLRRPDVKLPMFENIYDYDIDSILFELFQYCEREAHPIPDIRTAIEIANRKFSAANMRSVSNIVSYEPLPEILNAEWFNGVNTYVSPHCPHDMIYVLTHNEDAGAIAKNGIKFGIGIWHPSVCIGFSTNYRSTTNLLDLMVDLDDD